MRLNWNSIFAVLLLVLMVVFFGCGEDEPEISSVEDLKDTDAKNIIWKKDGAKMVLIPAGTFEMGDYFNEGKVKNDNEIPVHLDAFYMDVTEVTVGQFKKFLKSSGYKPTDPIPWPKLYITSPTGDHPMIYVNWFVATAYCEWAGKRLPTLEEWDFAARGGLVDKKFPWGDDESVAEDYANYNVNSVQKGRDKWDRCAPVGSFKPNGYGLYDMAGNVWEWCADWYPSLRLANTRDQRDRVIRGGSWESYTWQLSVAGRGHGYPGGGVSNRGFRCVTEFPAAKQ